MNGEMRLFAGNVKLSGMENGSKMKSLIVKTDPRYERGSYVKASSDRAILKGEFREPGDGVARGVVSRSGVVRPEPCLYKISHRTCCFCPP